MQPVYIDIHIHTSDNPNIINKDYDVDSLLEKIKEVSKGKEVLISLTDHNTLNRNAYMALCDKDINVIMGAELHIKKYDSAPPYHCHILFDCDVSEKNIESINGILDELYPDKVVTDTTLDIPNIEKISNAFDAYDYILLPHGGQSHRTFDKATAKGHRFDTSMEKSIYYNHFEGFTARSNTGLEDTHAYFKRLGIDQFTNLITCSDNYNPTVYPQAKSKDSEAFIPTWIFSEPTYAGLKLALSEDSRLYYGEEPPEKWSQSIFGVFLNNEKCEIDIALMPGLNVVIGGSSSGKTLLVDSIARSMLSDFEHSQYLEFGVKDISINNPSGVAPHYINQNFIISVLQNGNLQLGDIELINEVFPEEDIVKKEIRQNLQCLKKLVEQLVDAVEKYEQCQNQLIHLAKPSHLIISKEIPKRIGDLIKPSAEDKNRYNLSKVDYKKYCNVLNEIKMVFDKSGLQLKYMDEISTLKTGLEKIYEISELSASIASKVDSVIQREITEIAEDDRENSQKVEQRKRLGECLTNILRALKNFHEAKEELRLFDVNISTREIEVGGHKLRIENEFKLTKDVLVEAINKFIKSEKRIKSFEDMIPETLFKSGFSERPKVTNYSDLSEKIYNEISGRNRRTYKIETSDGRDFDTLSPGWKSAVILDLLLGYEKDVAPLIIDQPEDNLATDYINHGLIEQIKHIKPKKQIILVSHNATIPMLGDAQNVIVCKNDCGKIVIKSATLESEIDQKRTLDYIADITDGGKPSIRKRVKKYDLKRYKEC